VKGGHEVYKGYFLELFLVSITLGVAATLSFFFLSDIKKLINEHIAVYLR
jgi:hypothetical protein